MADRQPTQLLGTDRINAFSDGVFAIAATLLVLQIHIPTATEIQNSHQDLATYLLTNGWISQLIGFLISFLVVATYRTAHHRLFIHVAHSDAWLGWMNTFFLLTISFLPFPTGLFSGFSDNQFAFTIYAATLAAAGLVLAILWLYISFHPELLREGEPPIGHDTALRVLVAPVVFLLSIPLYTWLHSDAPFFWLTLIPASALEANLMKRFGPKSTKIAA
jgi:uncharacterized membrane protein